MREAFITSVYSIPSGSGGRSRNATAVVHEHPPWIHFKAQALVEMRSLGGDRGYRRRKALPRSATAAGTSDPVF